MPNILLITSDQQHFSTLGFLNPKIQTPNLDRLARQGTHFNRAYCPNPTCTPTRASIITGQYPSWHGAWTLGTHLREDAPTVGAEFGKAGFYTALVGKAHFQGLGSTPEYPSHESQPRLRDLDFWRHWNGPWYGFEHIETARMHADEYHVGGHYGVWMEERGLSNWRDFFQNYPPDAQHPPRHGSWDLPEQFHYSTWTAERTIAQFDRAGERPFFVWSSFHDPHPPYLVPEPWASMYDPADMEIGSLTVGELELLPPHFALTQSEKPDFSAYLESGFGIHGMHSHLADEQQARQDMATYYGMTSFMDAQIGRILDALEERGQSEDTLIVFSTDHGHFLGQHGLWAKGPFHFEDEIRVPFLVSWPDKVPANQQSSALQSLVDLAPTFLAAANLEIPGRMQGCNQLDVWRGEADSVRDEVLVEFHHEPTTIHLRTLVTKRWKMTVYRGQSYGELFDLETDPAETRNLWSNPEFALIKADLFQQWVNAELKREPMEMPRIAHA
ncbi:arylsulfatase [Abditibacteriota bacterium]|nr:arylsulfatase [Abditibacteriota bacterium]